MSKKAALGAAVLLLAAALFVLRRPHSAESATSSAMAILPADAGPARAARKLPALPAPPVTVDKAAELAKGTRLVQGGWGAGPGQFGHHKDGEGNAEGPASLTLSPNGDVWVLDQVNRRVQRFSTDGKPLGGFDTGADTNQDLVVDDKGRVLLLDRLADAEVSIYEPDGKPLGSVPVVGGAITEGGGVTGVFTTTDGVYLERENTEVVRVADGDGKPDPERPTQPGRPTRDGQYYLAAQLVDAASGRVLVRAFDRDAVVAWQREVIFPTQVVHLLLLDSDRRGHVVLGAFVAQDGPPPEHELVDPATVVVRLDEQTGNLTGSLRLPANQQAEEIFRELSVTDDGQIVQLLLSETGTEVLRYSFP